ALHLFDRRAAPSFEEGNLALATINPETIKLLLPPPCQPLTKNPSSSLSRRRRSVGGRRFCVCHGGGDGQLNLGARIELAPYSQFSTDGPGAFVHTGQTVVSLRRLSS